MRHLKAICLLAIWTNLASCATSHVMIGQARPAISPDSVKVYTRPPDAAYEEIGRLDTSSQGSFKFTAQGKQMP